MLLPVGKNPQHLLLHFWYNNYQHLNGFTEQNVHVIKQQGYIACSPN